MDKQGKKLKLRHRSRILQVPIYLGKQLRSFIYMNDWKMLPMAAIIAALVSMVVRKDYFLTMEGTLKGSFAMTCVAIWNGCFNSIQVICRERAILKREHRSGLHISAYVFSVMLYQALLCAGQTAVMLWVCQLMGVNFPAEGCITGVLMLDLAITLFLVTYASDMVSLLVSSIAHSTTAAMTVMPFILIFQLVFSGGIFNLPGWANKISNYTISNYGFKCLQAQAGYNDLPMVTGWNTLVGVQDNEISGTVTVGEILDFAGKDEGVMGRVRATEIDTQKLLEKGESYALLSVLQMMGQLPDVDIGAVIATSTDLMGVGEFSDTVESIIGTMPVITVGQIIDWVAANNLTQSLREVEIPYKVSVSDILDTVGRDELKTTIQRVTAKTMHKDAYDNNPVSIMAYWFILCMFIVIFAGASVIVLEFIDKDKR